MCLKNTFSHAENKDDSNHITNFSFLATHTGELYLYVFNHLNGTQNTEAFILLKKDDVRSFFLQNKITAPKIYRVRIEDLDDINFSRQLERMEEQDKIIKEKILIPLACDVFSEKLTDGKKSEDVKVSESSFISLRNPYDIQHVTDQMAERKGRLKECNVEAGGVYVCGAVWLTEA